MRKIKFILTALIIVFATSLSANAYTIGYADFQRVISEYTYARNAYKDIDNKLLELQEYAINKDKQYKTIESPIQKKTFEQQIQKEFKTREDRIYNLKVSKENEIRTNILNASKLNEVIELVIISIALSSSSNTSVYMSTNHTNISFL